MEYEIVNQLLADVVNKYGRSPELDNFKALSDDLLISPSILKRLYCYPTRRGFPMRLSTLDSLARYVGYEDFTEYTSQKRGELVFIIGGKAYTYQEASAVVANEASSKQSSEHIRLGSKGLLQKIGLTDSVTDQFVKEVKEGGFFSPPFSASKNHYKGSIFGDCSAFKLDDLAQLFFFLVKQQMVENNVENFALFVLRFSGKDILRSNDEFQSKPITWLTPSNSDALPYVIERIINDENKNARAGDPRKWEKTARYFTFPSGTIDRELLRNLARPYHEKRKTAEDEFTGGLERLLSRLMHR